MEVVDRSADVRKIDATVRDKFRWDWLENKDDNGVYYSDYVRKLNCPGKALCTVCNSPISYGSSGKKALLKVGK